MLYMMDRDFIPKSLLTAPQILSLISRMLIRINPSLGKVSLQSTFISSYLVKTMKEDTTLDLKNTMLLSLFHLIGFYHFIGERTIKFSDFTEEEIYHSYLYGYYYLKEMSPLEEIARTLLFYDKKYDPILARRLPQVEYASLLFSSRGIQQLIENTGGSYLSTDFENYGFSKYNHTYIDNFERMDIDKVISKKIKYGTYLNDLDEFFKSVEFTDQETESLFKLLIYIIDFKSTQTVQHIIHTSGYAAAIGKELGCSKDEINELFTAGALHDLGKVSIPNVILESTERLSPFEYRIMQMHVEETETILEGIVDEKIKEIAVRHHEKLDGSGYPNHYTHKELTMQQRYMTIADILSALVDKRSYKEKLSEEKIIEIFQKMADNKQIDDFVTEFLTENLSKLFSDMEFYSSSLSVPLGKVEIQYQEELSNEL